MLPARILDEAAALPLDEHPASVYCARLSSRSRRTQLGALEQMARILSGGRLGWRELPWQQLRYQHTQALRRQLADRYAVATANRMLAALRGCLQECWRLGLVDRETYARAVDLAPVRGTPPPHGRALAPDELRRLLAACAADTSPAGERDAALLGLLYACGLRRAEAVALDVADLDLAAGSLVVRRGKGNKSRPGFLSAEAAGRLRAWLAVLPHDNGPLFVRIRRGGALTDERLSDQSVRLILRRRCREAGVQEIAPHSMRRTFVTHLLEQGADIAVVQRLAGHAQITTTTRYDRRGEGALRQAAGLLRIAAGE